MYNFLYRLGSLNFHLRKTQSIYHPLKSQFGIIVNSRSEFFITIMFIFSIFMF